MYCQYCQYRLSASDYPHQPSAILICGSALTRLRTHIIQKVINPARTPHTSCLSWYFAVPQCQCGPGDIWYHITRHETLSGWALLVTIRHQTRCPAGHMSRVHSLLCIWYSLTTHARPRLRPRVPREAADRLATGSVHKEQGINNSDLSFLTLLSCCKISKCPVFRLLWLSSALGSGLQSDRVIKRHLGLARAWGPRNCWGCLVVTESFDWKVFKDLTWCKTWLPWLENQYVLVYFALKIMKNSVFLLFFFRKIQLVLGESPPSSGFSATIWSQSFYCPTQFYWLENYFFGLFVKT